MLRLLTPTPDAWATEAVSDMPRLLADHAHCELKAAQTALSLIGRFGGEFPALIDPLSKLAREETQHFRQVSERLDDLGASLDLPRKDAYVRELWSVARSDHSNVDVFLDRLLTCSLIEARSCERFDCLVRYFDAACESSEGEELRTNEAYRAFYRRLMEAEAKHFTLFSGLATERYGEEARERLAVLASREASIADKLPLGPSIHG